MNLDDAFPYEIEELIERALAPYLPVLSRFAMVAARAELNMVIMRGEAFAAAVRAVEGAACGARPSVAGLDPAQVCLLGEATPRRVLDGVVADLELSMEGGSEESRLPAHRFMVEAFDCVSDLADHHPPVAASDAAAAAQGISAFLDLASAAAMAGIVGTALDWQSGEAPGAGRQPADIGRHCMWLLQAFARVERDEVDSKVFRVYFEKQLDVEHVAEHRGRPVAEEIELRRSFLSRFGPRLVQAIARLTEETGPDPARGDVRSSPRLRAYVERVAQKHAAKARR